MADTTQLLADVAREHLLAEKWLIAPSRRIGHQWVERVVREGTDVLNLRVTTPLAIALELAGPSMTSDGVTLATETVRTLIVTSVWEAVAGSDYLGRLEPTGSIAALLQSSLNDLRLADVDSDSLDEQNLEHADKAGDLTALLDAYLARLGEERLVDDASVYRRAIDRIESEGVDTNTLYLVPRSARPTGWQRRFLESFPAEQRLDVAVAPKSKSDSGLVSWLTSNEAPKPRGDGSVAFQRAVGEVNEVRSVLRRCLADKIAVDEVELLVSDVPTYVPLIHDVARGLVHADRPNGLPVTFADGLSVAGSRPGRALAAWLEWVAADHPQWILVRMVADGLLDHGSKDSKPGPGLLAELLRPLAIGFGCERYVPKLDEQIAAIADEIRELEGSNDEEDVARVERRRRRVDGLRVLKKSIASLVAVSEGLGTSPVASLKSALMFLDTQATCIGEFDEFARIALCDEIREALAWIDRLGANFDVETWLAGLPESTRVLGNGPKPGHVHVASLRAGGHAGRPATFVLGLDDGRFPGSNLPDPILLDRERRSLSDALPTSSDRLEDRLEDLAKRLATVPGRLTLSWSCKDVREGSEMFPSPFVLSVLRLITGEVDADIAELDRVAGPPISFASADDPTLTEGELWLSRFSNRRTALQGRREAVYHRFPHLGRGQEADARRFGGSANEFNGFVPSAGIDLDPFVADHAGLSASALQTVGRCPLSYFFARGLGLFALDEPEIDADRWLDPATYGSLLHEVFRSFMAELAGNEQRPKFDRDNLRLAAILSEAIERQREETPPPNETAFRTQCWELAQVARVFLDREEEHCRSNRPRYFELAIGTDRVGEGTELDSPEPVAIALPSGRSLRAKGQIDRVDEIDPIDGDDGPPRYGVWDYKSGSAWGYSQADPFAAGRRVQNVLYRLIVDEVLGHAGSVAEAGYFFPGTRAQGLRVSWPAETLDAGADILDALGRVIASGAFVATSQHDDCRFCDHATICGDTRSVAAHGKRLLGDPSVTEIADFRELRS